MNRRSEYQADWLAVLSWNLCFSFTFPRQAVWFGGETVFSLCVLVLENFCWRRAEFNLADVRFWTHYATSRKVAVSSPDEVDFFRLT
jgi:hypothetical protein